MGRTTQQQVSPGLILQEAHPDDAFVIVNQLRSADQIEMSILVQPKGLTDMGEHLAGSIKGSSQAWSILANDGRMLGVWGHGAWDLSGPRSGEGFVWLVSTDELFEEYAKDMTRLARDYFFPKLDKAYTAFGNVIHQSNSVHLTWLRRLGFEDCGIHEIHGEPFVNLMRS